MESPKKSTGTSTKPKEGSATSADEPTEKGKGCLWIIATQPGLCEGCFVHAATEMSSAISEMTQRRWKEERSTSADRRLYQC